MDETRAPGSREPRTEQLRDVADQLGVELSLVEAVVSAVDSRRRTDPRVDSWEPPPAESIAPPTEATLGGPLFDARYEVMDQLGQGGMGAVHRVYDRLLERTVALKVLHPALALRPANAARFLAEAQVSAQLQHPAIVPVHDYGPLPDGRLYITMKEVQGQTLGAAIRALHAGAPEWNVRRLLEALRRACEGVAYAHERGVVHRDLKPENIMLGRHGEVSVLDWGLARTGLEVDWRSGADPVISHRTEQTRAGLVAGSPAYMAPEQARGDQALIAPWTDVYALGGVLYEILVGTPPMAGLGAQEILARLRADVRVPPPSSSRFDLPDELIELVGRATSPVPEARHADAGVFGEALADWLDGARRRERALALVDEADATGEQAETLEREAATFDAESRALLADVPAWAPEWAKAQGWRAEDAAREKRQAAEDARDAQAGLLSAALTQDPACPEAHARLATDYRALHAEAEARGDDRAARRWERHLRNHDRGEHAAWLEGTGQLSLVTDPPCQVSLLRYVERQRRLVAEPVQALGTTPLEGLSLPRGSYLLVLRAAGCDEVHYPVVIRRREHWDGVAPGDSEPTVIRLPRTGELGPDDVYVPAGWFWSGGEIEGIDQPLPRRRLWADPFVIRRHPVTCRTYLDFLDGLVSEGREQDALRFAAREPAIRGQPGALVLGRTEAGGFCLVPDAQGDLWPEDLPMIMVDEVCAQAYADWEALRTGQPWQLPPELLVQKAARGVDGRLYPWGNHHDPAWCCGRDSREGSPQPGPVSEFAGDESPYGVCDLAGNVMAWSSDGYPRGGPVVGERVGFGAPPAGGGRRVLVGASWNHSGTVARADFRVSQRPGFRSGTVGIRLLRSLG